jgi:hypothetical protein
VSGALGCVKRPASKDIAAVIQQGGGIMTKEEAWLLWMKESKRYVEYDWDTIKKSSHWEAFSRGWDAASINVNGWDDAYKMGMEAGKEMEKSHAV